MVVACWWPFASAGQEVVGLLLMGGSLMGWWYSDFDDSGVGSVVRVGWFGGEGRLLWW